MRISVTPSSLGYQLSENPSYPTHYMARELIFELFEEDICSGKALEMLSCAPYDDCAFPMARQVKLFILLDKVGPEGISEWGQNSYGLPCWSYSGDTDDTGISDEVYSSVAEANVCAFVQRIKEAAPMLREIDIQPRAMDVFIPSPSRLFRDLVSRLTQLASRITYGDYEERWMPTEPLQSRTGNLVHLAFVSKSDNTWFRDLALPDGPIIQLVQRNAPSLQYLFIWNMEGTDIGSLIKGSDDSFTVYPNLHTLTLAQSEVGNEPCLTVSNDIAPFPCLRRLDMPRPYLFHDDTPFRGNAATLEHLHMVLNPTTIDMLRRHRVFTPPSHAKLQYVSVLFDRDVPNVYAPDIDRLQFALSMGPGAAVRGIGRCRYYRNNFISTLAVFDGYDRIQVLVLPDACPDLWQAIELVKLLPLLSDLHTGPPVVGPIPAGVARNELPAYVATRYAPASERFRCWRYGSKWGDNEINEVECVLLVALACPSLTYVPLYAPVIVAMEHWLASDTFKAYAPRLQRLLSRK